MTGKGGIKDMIKKKKGRGRRKLQRNGKHNEGETKRRNEEKQCHNEKRKRTYRKEEKKGANE